MPKAAKKLVNIMDALADSAENLSDDEILEDAKAAGVDPKTEAARVRKVLTKAIKLAKIKTGRVKSLNEVRGVMSFRFVSKNWTSLIPHLMWFEFDPIKHVDEYEKQRNDMAARAVRLRIWNGQEWDFTATWYKNGEPFYTTRIDYHPIERPVLVLIGGF